ncbi:peroxisomal membrane anchor protein conserved region-domain-containing protein [Polychytrium aggregatum]|uniref:peroxisomal membrane anchor protein conserved region-domain-containing protein n=1 Tax=Polychytrium aggregatum TaxID=110093 RepID=UPI0022FDF8A5|nr:peroxisomal membrane anchor protein conserved region-domain-containing protein [Polychytrium aggregatum]KAI9203156.1 peroxisomal membrane anchor protein conserved region-domain-containing protein [Polychytrium aggregatum]
MEPLDDPPASTDDGVASAIDSKKADVAHSAEAGAQTSPTSDGLSAPMPISDPNAATLSSNDRARIRAELLAKQQSSSEFVLAPSIEAHESEPRSIASAGSSSPTQALSTIEPPISPSPGSPSKLRNDKIELAVAFLTNQSIQNERLSKKIEFLQSKGLTPNEVNAALERAAQNPSAGTAAGVTESPRPPNTNQQSVGALQGPAHPIPPPLPPRLPHSMPHYYHPVPAHRDSIPPLIKYWVVIVVVCGGLAGLVLGWVKIYGIKMYNSFVAALSDRIGVQKKLFLSFAEQVLSLGKYYGTSTDAETSPSGSSKSLTSATRSQVRSVSSSIKKAKLLLKQIQSNGSSHSDESLQELKVSLLQLSQYVTHKIYFNPGASTLANYPKHPAGSDGESDAFLSAAQELKSEIRGLKGALLSRRNFPVIGTTAPEAATADIRA